MPHEWSDSTATLTPDPQHHGPGVGAVAETPHHHTAYESVSESLAAAAGLSTTHLGATLIPPPAVKTRLTDKSRQSVTVTTALERAMAGPR